MGQICFDIHERHDLGCNQNIPMLIDDQRLRKKMAQPSLSLIQEISKLSEFESRFNSIDKALYESWLNLTFRDEHQRLQDMERRLKKLNEIQMHLYAIAENSRISISEAFQRLLEEESQFQCGDEDWKFIISKLRENRLQFAHEKLNQRIQGQRKSIESKSTLFDFEHDVSRAPVEKSLTSGPDLSRLNRKKRSVYFYFKEMNEEQIKTHLAQNNKSFHLFKEIFFISIETGDWVLFSRVWNNSPDISKQKILQKLPFHLFELIQSIIESTSKEIKRENLALDSDQNEDKEIILRSIYRKLMRIFHPDRQLETVFNEIPLYFDGILAVIQKAYADKNLPRLKALELKAAFFSEDLNSLSLDEIYQSSIAFAEELEDLKSRIKNLTKHPAWKFSVRRSLTKLEINYRTTLEKKMIPFCVELQELEAWLEKVGLKIEELPQSMIESF